MSPLSGLIPVWCPDGFLWQQDTVVVFTVIKKHPVPFYDVALRGFE